MFRLCVVAERRRSSSVPTVLAPGQSGQLNGQHAGFGNAMWSTQGHRAFPQNGHGSGHGSYWAGGGVAAEGLTYNGVPGWAPDAPRPTPDVGA